MREEISSEDYPFLDQNLTLMAMGGGGGREKKKNPRGNPSRCLRRGRLHAISGDARKGRSCFLRALVLCVQGLTRRRRIDNGAFLLSGTLPLLWEKKLALPNTTTEKVLPEGVSEEFRREHLILREVRHERGS